ncbi:MAG: biosynthetic-type acetolactate synthase large subunit [Ruminococcaceae bacterium]|nr:biosynthetic-type acetolactate synthase large subunit [Oscillospiraceae bacterium]
MVLSGADIIVRTLIEQGVDTVFGYPGGQIIDVYDSLYKYQNEIKHILTAHEQGAAHAADGYSRTTGKVGVVISTSGPGATNLVTGIATAHLDSVPLVAICGNVPTYQLGTDGFQEIDITGITLPITKHNYVVDSVDKLADTIREAFFIANSGRPGPVLIDVPKDVQTAECEYESKSAVSQQEKYGCEDISDAVKCLRSAKRPFIYFGGGAIISGAENEIIRLADLIDAPIGCSLMGISGVPSDHPRFLGMQGMHGRYASSAAMASADCILALGVRFSDRATGDASKFAPSAKIIHIDVDSAEFSKNVFPAFELKGDVKLTLEKFISALKKKKRTEWMMQVSKFKEYENSCADNRNFLTPHIALSALNKYLDADTPVVTDVGQHQMWAAQIVKFSKTRRFVTSGGLGTMGFGIGAAIGAYFGTGKRTVLITGDGSFGMSLNEIATAVSNKIPVVILMLNNGVLGMVRQWQTFFYDKHYSATVLDRKTDFIAIMKAFGADAVCVNSPDELGRAYEKAFASDCPFLIDCRIDKDELVLPMMPPGGTAEEIIVKVGE